MRDFSLKQVQFFLLLCWILDMLILCFTPRFDELQRKTITDFLHRIFMMRFNSYLYIFYSLIKILVVFNKQLLHLDRTLE